MVLASKVRFRPPIVHPNVYFDGDVRVRELEEAWTMATTVVQVLDAITHLVDNPAHASSHITFFHFGSHGIQSDRTPPPT